ncbi:hypothetical protein AWM70_06020 [Paenibacillus yonginensis]|uniref:Uncharacterized protein n=1 Tax=Paenibacillus yonginensis TaxID=1462996 RepID=A0A1B1MYD1_9BACL|nr:halocarboxylic acid dehydrogenase DehI family protein [Paenibacillus yonginensis]ANS74192.1 hypothetical protein AWM70_06020 [Paenibacillus yonginensis]
MLDNRAVSEQMDHGFGSLSEELCGDIVSVLGVSRVPWIFRALETFGLTKEAWSAVRMNLMSEEAEEAAKLLRTHRLGVPPLLIDWRNLYSPGSFEHLRSLVNASYESNPRLLLMVSLWVEGLSGRSIRGRKGRETGGEPVAVSARREEAKLPLKGGKGAPKAGPIENALSSRLLMNEIAEYHTLWGMPDDYSALILYPEFLRIHWGSLKPHLKSSGYAAAKRQIVAEASMKVHELPYAADLSGWFAESEQTFGDREQGETDKARLLELLYLLQDQLAGLLLEISFIRSSLH